MDKVFNRIILPAAQAGSNERSAPANESCNLYISIGERYGFRCRDAGDDRPATVHPPFYTIADRVIDYPDSNHPSFCISKAIAQKSPLGILGVTQNKASLPARKLAVQPRVTAVLCTSNKNIKRL